MILVTITVVIHINWSTYEVFQTDPETLLVTEFYFLMYALRHKIKNRVIIEKEQQYLIRHNSLQESKNPFGKNPNLY